MTNVHLADNNKILTIEQVFPHTPWKFLPTRPESFYPHALKGQKLLAQGSALGNYVSKPVAL